MPRIALITGGSRGLGRAAALALADAGVDSVVTYRTGEAEAAETVAEVERRGRRAVALQLDTMDAASFGAFATILRGALAETWGAERFDILVNNAGFAEPTPFGATEEAAMDRLFAVHVKGPVLLTQELAPLLADGGRILNLSTGLTRIVYVYPLSIYAAVKSAVETWTLYLANELGSRGIAVNSIAPGATATDFGGGAVRDDPVMRETIGQNVAFGRVGEAEDIGAAIAAILSPGMAWVTGQRIEASGGQALSR